MFGFMQMGMQFLQGQQQAIVQNAVNDANATLNDAQTYATNLQAKTNADNANNLRNASNGFQAAQASLAETQRSLSNNAKADAIGGQYNASTTNLQRAFDQLNRGSVEQQISNASTLGAVRADAAARGVGGTSAQIMRSTLQQTQARQATQLADKTRTMTLDGMMTAAGLQRNLVTSQDFSQSLAAIDYGVNIPAVTLSPMRAINQDPTAAGLQSVLGGGSMASALSGIRSGGSFGGSGGSLKGGFDGSGISTQLA